MLKRKMSSLALMRTIVFTLWIFVPISLVGNALHGFPTVDEIGHLPAGVSHWKFSRFDLYRVNPPFVRTIACSVPGSLKEIDFDWTKYSAAVGKRPEFDIGFEALRSEKLRLANHFWLPRCLGLVLSWFGAFLIFDWCARTIGYRAAILSSMLWTFSPSILACTPTLVPDLGACTFGVLACYSAWHYLHAPTFGSAIRWGFALGIAILCKLTWLTAILTLPLAVGTLAFLFRKHLPARKILLRIVDLLFSWGLALLTLNVGYIFEDSFMPFGEFKFCSSTLGGPDANLTAPGNQFEKTWLASVPVPFPRNFILGIDYIKYEVEEKKWSFLNGEWKLGSWTYYYLLTILYKTPESTLLLTLIGLGVIAIGLRRGAIRPEAISMLVLLGFPAGFCFASVSMQGGFNHHHRYVLMIYPPMFALGAYIASPVGVKLLRFRLPFLGRKRRSIAIPLAITLVTLSAASSLRVHPYYTSYFNTLSGGPENGWHRLGFSNIDWGQDILEVDQWLKKHPERRSLVMDIDYFGMNGDLFDVPTSLPPQLPLGASVDEVRRSIKETQWWIISAKKLYNLPDQPGLQYLQQIEPVERIAYAYHVYRIDPLPPAESSSSDEPTL